MIATFIFSTLFFSFFHFLSRLSFFSYFLKKKFVTFLLSPFCVGAAGKNYPFFDLTFKHFFLFSFNFLLIFSRIFCVDDTNFQIIISIIIFLLYLFLFFVTLSFHKQLTNFPLKFSRKQQIWV